MENSGNCSAGKNEVVLTLSSWKMRYAGFPEISCMAPCSLYSVLEESKCISEPYDQCNVDTLTKLSNNNCIFTTEIELDRELLIKQNLLLKFYGLDTLCDIYFNNTHIAHTDNMHRTYIFDIKPVAVLGSNRIELVFSSPVQYIQEANRRHPLITNADSIPGAAHIRKALYMFGWDWAPTLPDMGIFRKVEILGYDEVLLENALIMQIHNGDGSVDLDIQFEVSGNSHGLTYGVTVGDQTVVSSQSRVKIRMDSPNLWWPNGYGEQHLYCVKLELLQNGEPICKISKTIGLRTLTVSREPDQYGEEFCFVVNGIKIFAMGADYIPQDSLLTNVTHEKTEALLKDCVKANFNMIRVWGGGIYPDDTFYDICDRLGLIVWQDFMFSCIGVYLCKPYEDTVTMEAIDNVKRLRHHASLGLWCGNNEIEEGMVAWEEVKDNLLIKNDYLKLFERILPDICTEYSPQTYYWPSSPSSGGGFDAPCSENKGDVHCWAVWHKLEPFSYYRTKYFRFLSEFGFESFPDIKTINTFARHEDKNIFSEVMENHQKNKSGNAKILHYCAQQFLYLTNFEDIVYASQLLQAWAMQCAVEHMRRHRGRCMGSLYWQLNDCWPVASWSSIDYYGRWKALHYFAKRFYTPVLLSLHEEGSSVIINVANETLQDFAGYIRFGVYGTNFEKLFEDQMMVRVGALQADDVAFVDVTKQIEGRANSVFFSATLTDGSGNRISGSSVLFVPPKRFQFERPSIRLSTREVGGKKLLTVQSDTYVRGCALAYTHRDGQFSDNYFDIISEEPVEIAVENVPNNLLLDGLVVKTLNEIR